MESLIAGLAVFTLFGSAIAFWGIVVAMIIGFIISDVSENGWAAFGILVVFVTLNVFSHNDYLLDIITFKNVGIYLGAGFGFSLIRTYFKGKELTRKDAKLSSEKRKSTLKEEFALKEHVFRWWFLFPVCAINWIFTDLIKNIYEAIYPRVEKVYLKLFNA